MDARQSAGGGASGVLLHSRGGHSARGEDDAQPRRDADRAEGRLAGSRSAQLFPSGLRSDEGRGRWRVVAKAIAAGVGGATRGGRRMDGQSLQRWGKMGLSFQFGKTKTHRTSTICLVVVEGMCADYCAESNCVGGGVVGGASLFAISSFAGDDGFCPQMTFSC